MERIKVGIIGGGFMGAAHAEALRRLPGVEIAVVTSRSRESAERVASRFNIDRIVADWTDLLSDDSIDVIHNCTPNHLHYEVNKASLKAGKHVFAEKPLTVSSDESRELIRIARERGLVTGVNFNYRSYPLIRQARELVESDTIGKVFLVHGHYVQDWLLYDTDYNWRLDASEGGPSRAIADIGSHWCDLVQFVTGLEIESVFADLFTVHPTRERPARVARSFEKGSGSSERVSVDTEDGGTILLRFKGGARGAATISQVSAGRKNHQWFEIDGSKRALAWNQERPNELWIGNRSEPNQTIIKDPSLLDRSASDYAHYPGGDPEGYRDALLNTVRNFYRFLQSDSKPGIGREDFPTFTDGHRSVTLVESVLKSHRRQAWVAVEG